jgi:hypothetical protein
VRVRACFDVSRGVACQSAPYEIGDGAT